MEGGCVGGAGRRDCGGRDCVGGAGWGAGGIMLELDVYVFIFNNRQSFLQIALEVYRSNGGKSNFYYMILCSISLY